VTQTLTIHINGQPVEVPAGSTIAAALLQAGALSRVSVHGEPRQPLCGMGICYECRAAVDGTSHQRTCQILCRPGMQVSTE
jgi:predicted molibdopterin-dependent oxidoreductase YjgC